MIAQCSDESATLAVAEIDLEFLKRTRQKLPIWSDRRPELYGLINAPSRNVSIEDNESYSFGPIKIKSKQVFYKTNSTFAFVNHRPVLPGHVLISPIREGATRLSDLNSSELADFFAVVQKVQPVIESVFGANSSTIAIQDGEDAGRSVDHLHVHLLPRRKDDFGGKTDQVYHELRQHDKEGETKKRPPRSEEEMQEEASRLRRYF